MAINSCSALFAKVCLFSLWSFSFCVQAQISFDGATRFVLNSDQKLITMIAVNEGADTALVQVMLERGEPDDAEDLPLAISKPLLLIPPYGKASIDIIYQGQGLPNDRESYFLIKALVVPKKAKNKSEVSLAVQHNLKLFYRPVFASSIESAYEEISWTKSGDVEAGVVENKSPYYLTMTNIQFFNRGGQECGNVLSHMMLKPFQAVSVSALGCGKDITHVNYRVVGDSGITYARTAKFPLVTGVEKS
ncbi:molecular chaperone [Pseudomonas tructae]|uniref:Molecular chaperone n=1 Tax=Pseudomonas tructae TaxID=2518644 RepID=A0A411MJ93_9PSED|nr:molecular chaperone [Pseudomonas tructae]QBF26866.1 molecular chaperone [Pseudomonas tructae]